MPNISDLQIGDQLTEGDQIECCTQPMDYMPMGAECGECGNSAYHNKYGTVVDINTWNGRF